MKHLFLFGAAGYPLLELLYRRRTHYSMAIAGGASAVLIGRISRMNIPFMMKSLLCTAGITGIEAICGIVWNRDHRVWDYRQLPMNWRGQVCLPYSLVWCGLSAGMLGLISARSK